MTKKWEQRVVSHVLKRKVKTKNKKFMIWYERDWSIQVIVTTCRVGLRFTRVWKNNWHATEDRNNLLTNI